MSIINDARGVVLSLVDIEAIDIGTAKAELAVWQLSFRIRFE